LADVLDGVLPYRVVHADGISEVGGILCDCGGWWRKRCKDGLLECLEAVGFFEFSPGNV